MTFQDFMNTFLIGVIGAIILLGISAFIKICFWKAPWWLGKTGDEYNEAKKNN